MTAITTEGPLLCIGGPFYPTPIGCCCQAELCPSPRWQIGLALRTTVAHEGGLELADLLVVIARRYH
jgi:hypothetical protein